MGVVIVTGGSRGIGADNCRLAARRGYSVCVNYLHGEKEANEVVEEIMESHGRAISVKACSATISVGRASIWMESATTLGEHDCRF